MTTNMTAHGDPTEPPTFENQTIQDQYGAWLELPTDAITTMDYVDTDQDGVDDRKQAGPGMPNAFSEPSDLEWLGEPIPENQAKSDPTPLPSDSHFSNGKTRHITVPPPSTEKDAYRLLETTLNTLSILIREENSVKAHEESYQLIAASDALITLKPKPLLAPLYNQLSKQTLKFHETTETFLENPSKKTRKEMESQLENITQLADSIQTESLPK
jgi:hypothetical protein